VISGTLVDGEALNVIGTALTYTTADQINGVIVVAGAASGAVGQFSITGITPTGTWTDGETVSVTGSALVADVTAGSEAISDTPAQLSRLLLHEDENVWETASDEDLLSPWYLWLTPGSNTVWTVNYTGLYDELWALEDTVCIPVTGVTADSVSEDEATLSWDAMTGAEQYEYRWEDGDEEIDFTDDDEAEATLEDLEDDTDYDFRVRVAEAMPFTSRWSASYEFTTVEAIATPVNRVPENGLQDAPIRPSFLWDEVTNAVSYEFELGTAPDFSNATAVTTTVARLTWQSDLLYDQDYYWRVRAVSATGTKSGWCTWNFHTRMEEIPPVTVEPPPTPTIILPTPIVNVDIPDITLPQPTVTVSPPDVTVELPTPTVTTVQTTLEIPKEVTPAYIWAIVAIGALLVIAVIVLIIRTRRVV